MDEKVIEAIMSEAGVKGDPSQVLAILEASGSTDVEDETTAVHEVLERFPKLFEREMKLPPFKEEPDTGEKKKRVRYFPGKGKMNRTASVGGRSKGAEKARERAKARNGRRFL